MELYYETPGSIHEALQMLLESRAIFIDMEDALEIITRYPQESYQMYWNAPVQGRVVIIPKRRMKGVSSKGR